jgi:hypothetical protein
LLLCPAGIFGALYCLADVHTEFSEVAKQLKEVAEILGQGLNRQLSGPLLHEYLVGLRALLLGEVLVVGWFCAYACLWGVRRFPQALNRLRIRQSTTMAVVTHTHTHTHTHRPRSYLCVHRASSR